MPLSRSDVAHFREHGYIAPIDIMSPSEARDIAEKLAEAERTYPTELHAERRNYAHLCFPFLADLAVHAQIVDPVRSLVGDDISLSASVLFIKEPHSGAFVSWHQDATYMALHPADFVTAWVALTPSTAETGCVSVIPGTHHAPEMPHVDTYGKDNILTRGQQVSDIDTSRAVDLVLQPGQMSLHHPWLVHGSQPNRSDTRRVGVAFQSYLGATVCPTRGEHHVMHIHGHPINGNFIEAPHPTEICNAQGLAARAAAEAAYADVLYADAVQRRGL